MPGRISGHKVAGNSSRQRGIFLTDAELSYSICQKNTRKDFRTQSDRKFFQTKGYFSDGCGTIIQHLSEKYPEGFQDTK